MCLDSFILLSGASVAEVRPVGLSIAGVGGVAASKPTGTAVVGPGGLAIARPVATAIAGVPPDAVLGPAPRVPGQQTADSARMGAVQETYVAVGPQSEPTAKYGVVPITHYVRLQPRVPLNSVRYSQQPVMLYPIAYY
jgi:hypothetical protein